MSAGAPSPKDQRWLFAAAIPFLLSVALLGFAFNTGLLVAFAVGWPIIQILGYGGSLRLSKGVIDHPLVKTQVMLHYLVLALLAALLAKAL